MSRPDETEKRLAELIEADGPPEGLAETIAQRIEDER